MYLDIHFIYTIMRKFLTLSVLFVAMFTTLATNNTAYAQPESFTKDFVMKSEYIPVDGWENEYHICNVTAEYNASTKKLTIKDFFNNPGIPMVENMLEHFDLESNIGSWSDDGKVGTFTIPTRLVAQVSSQYNDFSYYSWVFVVNWSQDKNVPTEWGWDGGSNKITVIVDLNNDCMTMSKWSLRGAHDRYGQPPSKKIVRFNGSTFEVPRTELVDIVNDGTVGEEYEVYDDLVGVATVDGVLSPAMKVGTNTNSFMIGKGRYKFELDLSTNNVTVSQSTEDVTGYVNNNFDTYYIMGEVNGNNWAPNIGQPMKTSDGVHYSAVVECDEEYKENYYFDFTHYLASTGDGWEWNNIAQHRLGPLTNDYPVTMGNVLFAKDMGKYRYPSHISEGQIDFLGRVETEYMGNTKLQPIADFDQSNWVMLTGVANADNYVGKIIKGKSITGKLVDKVNPTIAVTSTPEVGDPNPYDPNIYIMPSFNEEYYAPNSHFFFVAPKVQEYAYITWACYNAADGNFYTMSDGNVDNLSGGIKVNWDYFPSGNPQDGYVYEFDAILRKVAPATSSAPLLKDGNQSNPVTDDLSTDYIVYPLRLYDVPTAINTVEATGKAVDVKYYNMMGIESKTPFSGVNIVVTTRDNGTRTNTKKLYK